MADYEVHFSKIKNLLKKNSAILREDPLISIEYLRILELIKSKKILEETGDPYSKD